MPEDKFTDVPLTVVSKERSSKIRGYHYEPTTQTLHVAFNAGKDGKEPVYRYDGFPQAEYTKFLNAPSMGVFLNQNIVGKYPYAKVWPAKKELATA